MQRRYEVSNNHCNKTKHIFSKAKKGCPGKD